ncbi:YidC/Oxa1 family membrane protein insertase [Brevibacillus dissolubilis]|uniref:YidC/Oxa1 family membrane protein insertase n=1 Tax=Brevibacillus dissolubilis TaxID=1844116 RepID=UPI0011164D49|nr:YidC/Oxa1 family membrane protein insertase [Brevibacillus dissolubilis]
MSFITQPIEAILNPLLTFFYQMGHDWGLAIILLTILVRLLMSPLNLRTARQMIRQGKMQPHMKKLQEKYAKDPEKMMPEMVALYKSYGVKPMSMFTTALVQMPIFTAMYFLFQSHGSAMSSILIPWVSTFAEADAWHLLPVLAGALTFATNMIPLTNENSQQAPFGTRITMSVVMVGMFTMLLWKAPVALALYWTTGSAYVLLERAFYRTKMGKTVLNRRLNLPVEA